MEVVRYTYRLRPGAEAVRALDAEWPRCRFLWNEAVHQQLIAVEDFRPRFLARSAMARKAADAICATKRELVERAVRAGRQVVIVAPAYTTMTCSSCFGRTNQRLALAERVFSCRECGYTDTRDRNAARTILAVAERGHTSVDDVRHGSDRLRMLGSRAV